MREQGSCGGLPPNGAKARGIRRVGMLWFAAGALLWVLFWGCEPKAPACQRDEDCTGGQRCQTGSCVPASEGSQEAVEAIQEGGEAQVETQAEEEQPEHPPWPDTRFPTPEADRPDRLQPPEERPPTAGMRKLGQTCDPARTALAQDRCEAGFLCVSAAMEGAGICKKSCSLAQEDGCASSERCGAIRSVEGLAPLGGACVAKAEASEPCDQLHACPKDWVCAFHATSAGKKGICLQRCEKAADCAQGGAAQGWCGSSRDWLESSTNVTACLQLVEAEGGRCDGPRLCGTGQRCMGETGNQRCRKTCTGGGACGQGERCVRFLDNKGDEQYAVCFPEREDGESCDATVRCKEGSTCATLSARERLCLRDCSTDPSRCNAQTERCEMWTTDRRACFRKDLPEGELCVGGALCSQGLACLSWSVGALPRCLRACGSGLPACESGSQCHQADTQSPSFCTTACNADSDCNGALTQCSAQACIPSEALRGTAGLHDTCSSSLLAPAKERCPEGLRCVLLADQARCLRPCDPLSPAACGGPLPCLWRPSLNGFFCGTPGSNGDCDLAESRFCQEKQRCVRPILSEKGRCTAYGEETLSSPCLEESLACASPLRCAGDPLTPYRWQCRQPCDGNQPCPAGESCLALAQGAACFPACNAQGACAASHQRCETLQGKPICLD